ncbi:MAG: fibronectin type III domain-containing protein [Coriobacteriia bacterium]|nr:fibronectin type III domain-containing protein [Coriobacteriia bacterium]
MKTTACTSRSLLAILAGVLTLVLAMPLASAYAAGTYTGGALPTSTIMVPNDHTPVVIGFSAAGLDPNAGYRLKVRLSPAPEPMNIQNRGWTWNPVTRQWVQEREQDRNRFPLMTTDPTGSIPEGWAAFAFGDEAMSGRYYILVSLNLEKGATFNGSAPFAVDVFDVETQGARLHNAAATGLPAGTLVKAVRRLDGSTVAASRTETDGVDGDANGRTDDEDHGTPGSRGDYSLCVPLNTSVDIVSGTTTLVAGITLTRPDEDIAIGATDMSAPTTATNLTATPLDRRVRLSWSPALDNTKVSKYLVYRWIEPPLGVPYSVAKTLIGSTSQTTYDDATPLGGLTYHYEVRAMDTATNVSARSNPVAATTIALPPRVRAATSPTKPNGAAGWFRKTAPYVSLFTDRGRLFYSWDSSTSVYATYTAPLRAPQGARKLFYYAADSSGNESAIASISVKTDTRTPSTTLSAPAISTRTSTARAFVVSLTSVDATPSSGTLRDLEYRTSATAPWRRLRTRTAAQAVTVTAPTGATYRFRARSTDTAGNVGAWSATRTTVIPYDDVSARYSGAWRSEIATASYGGRSRVTTAAGASATFTFSRGTEAHLITSKGPDRGRVRIYLDGRLAGTYDLYAATERPRAEVRIGRLSGAGRHTIRIVTLAGTGRRVDVDGLAVKR